MELNDGDSLY